MTLILRNVIYGLIAILFFWIPVLVAAVDCARGRGTMKQTLCFNWACWMQAFDNVAPQGRDGT